MLSNMKHTAIPSLFRERTLYYYILLYGSKLKENESFTEWQVADFILNNDPHYRNLYKGRKLNKANRIGAIVKTVKRNIPALLNQLLLEKTGVQQETKGSSLIPTYALTPLGRLISRIMQALELENGMAEKVLLSVILDSTSKVYSDSHPLNLFNSKLIKKMYEKGFFTNYVSALREATRSKSIKDIESFISLIQRTLSLKFYNPVLGHQFIDLCCEVLNELDQVTRELVLYDNKLAIDVKMGAKAATKEYSKLRYELKAEYDKVAIEGTCITCKQRSVFRMEIIEYLRHLAYIVPLAEEKCSKCESPEGIMKLPNLWT